MEKNFTVDQMKDAFLAVRSRASEKQIAMLREHYLNGTLSMERIAEAGGYSSYKAGNSQYGKLCGRIAHHLAFQSPGDQTFVIASVASKRDPKGHFQWTMDRVAESALRELGWFEHGNV